MGQKVHPYGFRLGINKTWISRWYADKNYSTNLHEDLKIRSYVKENLKFAGVSRVEIERAVNKIKVNVHTARPGVIIGKKGQGIDLLKKNLQKFTKNEIVLNIVEVKRPELDATLIAENIALQLEKRVAFRRAMKKAIFNARKFGAKGVKVRCSGRLAGAEIARSEWYVEGSVPLHTLRADIDYGTAEAKTVYGIIGLKVWIYKGDIINTKERGVLDGTRS
ncbi:MAG: 30S ribosomal protein S3 [Proteobacteria bacterium]|nr:30S ribosomal protein S3 [Pseudomonadota bacterium]